MTDVMPLIGMRVTVAGVEHVIVRIDWPDGTVWEYSNIMPIPTSNGGETKIHTAPVGSRRAWRAENVRPETMPCAFCNGYGSILHQDGRAMASYVCTACNGSGNALISLFSEEWSTQ